MVAICAAALCKNSSKKNSDIIFHSFPRNQSKELRQKWIHFCKRKDIFNPTTSKICSEHFAPEAYQRDLQNELLGLPQRKILSETACPSIFNPRCIEEKKVTSRNYRRHLKERQNFLNSILKGNDNKGLWKYNAIYS